MSIASRALISACSRRRTTWVEGLQRPRHLQPDQVMADAVEHGGRQLGERVHARLSRASRRPTAS